MSPSVKDYFHFNKSERRGTLSLIVLIVVLIIIKELLIFINPEPELSTINIDSLQHAIEIIDQRSSKEEVSENKSSSNDSNTAQLFDFNPNNLSIEKWQKLGLSKKQAETIKKYEKKGGSFKVKTDVQKMYTVSDELYAKLEPYILLPSSISAFDEDGEFKETAGEKDYKKWDNKVRTFPKVLINSADTAELKKLYGIGDYFALKIVEYRRELGGFVSKQQLKEIWGLKPETLQKIDTQLVLNSVPIRKIDINRASIDSLKAHPYIYWKVANSIVKYREHHGPYRNVSEIKQSALVSDSLFLKLEPYLKY